MRLAARLAGIGLVGPGLAGWAASRAVLAGAQPYAHGATVIAAPEALPAAERRRAGKPVRLALAAGLEAARDAGEDPASLAAVFAASTGDGENLHAICEALASDDRLFSPTRFHNSVHNAPAGYWSIAVGARGPADSLAAHDASFAAGLVEAVGRLAADPARGVLLVSYDAPYPEPLHAARPIPDAFAVALVLQPGAGSLALEMTAEPATRLEEPRLEALRAAVPSARALPLLALAARGGAGRVVLDYLGDRRLAVEVAP